MLAFEGASTMRLSSRRAITTSILVFFRQQLALWSEDEAWNTIGPFVRVFAASILLASTLVTRAPAQTTTYTYHGNPYQITEFSSPSICPITISFTMPEPLA